VSYPEPPIPANLKPYVDAMGRRLAVRFFLRFGGAPLYIPENPTSRSAVAELIGARSLRQLFDHFNATAAGTKNVRVPTARPWVAQQLRHEEMSISEIARTLHVSDVTVRKYLDEGDPEARRAAFRARQLQLF
jgi:transposase